MQQPFFFFFLLVTTSSALYAQGVFINADKPDAPTCSRVMVDKTELNYKTAWGGSKGQGADLSGVRYYQAGERFFPLGQRKDVSAFAAYDEHSKSTSISGLNGKVVLVGLWGTHCEPSAQMLMEFASIYAKRAQYGFEILAVNFDENQQGNGGAEGGWLAIRRFMIQNRKFFDVSHMPVYTPGFGKEGASNFMDMVYSLPVLFVVDREGRLAQLHIGYKNGFVGKALKQALVERPLPAPLPASQPAPTSPAAQAGSGQ